jgi:hypothetical protein
MNLTHTLALCAASFALVSTTSALARAERASAPPGEAIALKEVIVNVRPAHPSVVTDLERLVPLLELGSRPGVSAKDTERMVWGGPF